MLAGEPYFDVPYLPGHKSAHVAGISRKLLLKPRMVKEKDQERWCHNNDKNRWEQEAVLLGLFCFFPILLNAVCGKYSKLYFREISESIQLMKMPINSNWCPKSATVPLEAAWTKNIFQARFSVHFKMMAIVSENPVPGSWALLQWSKSVLVAAAVTASKREKNKNYNEKRPAKRYICSFFSSNHKLQLNSPAFCFSQVYGLS